MSTEEKGKWIVKADHYYDRFWLFDIRKSSRINPKSGETSDFVLMSGLNWCTIIALTRDGQIVLVRQYRHGTDSHTLELPGGVVDPAETDPAQAALRELREETGYTTSHAECLGFVHANPAMQSMKCFCYLARNVELTHQTELDPDEDIELVVVPLADAEEKILKGEISHAINLAAFGLLKIRYPEFAGPQFRTISIDEAK